MGIAKAIAHIQFSETFFWIWIGAAVIAAVAAYIEWRIK